MKEIKKTITNEVVEQIVSDDGKFKCSVCSIRTEEEARRLVQEYEQKLSTVLFQRLLDRGILKHLERKHVEDKESEEWKRQNYLIMFDGIVEDYCSNIEWYKFEPRTEEDVKDLLTYVETEGEGGISDTEYLGGFTCKRSEIVPDYTYMFGCHCDGYMYIYKIKEVIQKLNDMLGHIMIM